MAGDGTLGGFEEIVLLALLRVRAGGEEDAYGMTVRAELAERVGRDIAIGAVYSTLDRMEAKGWVHSRLEDPAPGRGGRPRRYFTVTEAGRVALAEARRARERLLEGLDDPLAQA